MIIAMNVISSANITDGELRAFLHDVGEIMGVFGLHESLKIYDGVSNVWIRLGELSEDEYDEEDIQNIQSLLRGTVRSIIVLEYDEGETAVSWVLRIADQLSKKYSIVLDNCYGRIYRAEEIPDLTVKGTF